jgi:hypothetical protein
LEAWLLRCSTHVSWFVLHFNVLVASILLLLFDMVSSILFIYPSYIVMMSRKILFQNIPNTNSLSAPKIGNVKPTWTKEIFVQLLPFWVFYFLISKFCSYFHSCIFPYSRFDMFILMFSCKKIVFSCITERSSGTLVFCFVLFLMKIVFQLLFYFLICMCRTSASASHLNAWSKWPVCKPNINHHSCVSINLIN